MGTTRLFDLIDVFIAEWPDVIPSSANVIDSYDTSQDYSNFVMVGVDDPDSQLAGQSASAQQSFALASGRARDEAGEIVCAAVATRGDSDMAAARADCKEITDSIENWTRTLNFNNYGILWLGFGSDLQLLQDRTNLGGAIATLIFRIQYKARI